MKKILAIFDGEHFSDATLDFAADLNSKDPIVLTGVFLPSVDYAEVVSYYYYGRAVVPVFLEEYNEDPVIIKKNIGMFEAFCRKHHIKFQVHQDIKKKVIEELKLQSRFADLMVLSSVHFYENLGEKIQEEYLEDTLHKTECPIVLLPGAYVKPTRIILAYDGSQQSMHAIRQLVYLLPHFTELETLVVHADKNKSEMPYSDLVEEYIAAHFKKIGYYELNIDPKKYFTTWLENKGAAFVVGGAYGRSSFSETFKKNFLGDVLKEQHLPLFIAHL